MFWRSEAQRVPNAEYPSTSTSVRPMLASTLRRASFASTVHSELPWSVDEAPRCCSGYRRFGLLGACLLPFLPVALKPSRVAVVECEDVVKSDDRPTCLFLQLLLMKAVECRSGTGRA